MDITTKLTVAKLTPSGYFNLAEDAPVFHKAYISWWNAILSRRAGQAAALRELILTPWLVDHPDTPRTTWLNYLLSQYGISYFSGTNNQAAAIYKLISNAWARSTLHNILLITQSLCMPPFSWFDSTFIPQVVVGNLLPSQMDTGFIVYSTAGSLPATPANVTYTPRAWLTPAGWTRQAASATYYTRGYITGGSLKWCTPRPISDFSNSVVFASTVPVAVASVGTLCIVQDDGTGDTGSVYYSDGTAWRKNSPPNEDLGLVDPMGVRPVPEAITVFAPDPAIVTYAIDSQVPPPLSGGTEGYGTFSTWSDTAVFSNEITVQLHQLSGGDTAIATVLDLLRRVMPIGKSFTVDIDGVKYILADARSV